MGVCVIGGFTGLWWSRKAFSRRISAFEALGTMSMWTRPLLDSAVMGPGEPLEGVTTAETLYLPGSRGPAVRLH